MQTLSPGPQIASQSVPLLPVRPSSLQKNERILSEGKKAAWCLCKIPLNELEKGVILQLHVLVLQDWSDAEKSKSSSCIFCSSRSPHKQANSLCLPVSVCVAAVPFYFRIRQLFIFELLHRETKERVPQLLDSWPLKSFLKPCKAPIKDTPCSISVLEKV